MRMLSLSILTAAMIATPTTASAEDQRPGPPPPGHTWRGGPPPGAHGPNVVVRHGGPAHPGADFRHRRLQRGFVVHPFWYGRQFHIDNWRAYGFADPGADHRWIRYYDDAYLIDRGGRVADTRYGLDWDQYGEQWEVSDGIPAYRGSREWRPGPDDYAWFQSQSGWDYGHYGHGAQGHAGYGHGGAYTQVHGGGYGYGAYAYPIIIETTTTTAATGYVEEIIEEYVQVRRQRRARARSCNCPAPRAARPAPRPAPRRALPRPARPPAGERG